MSTKVQGHFSPLRLLIVPQAWTVNALLLFCSHGRDKPLKPPPDTAVCQQVTIETGRGRLCYQVSIPPPPTHHNSISPPASTHPLSHTPCHFSLKVWCGLYWWCCKKNKMHDLTTSGHTTTSICHPKNKMFPNSEVNWATSGCCVMKLFVSFPYRSVEPSQ